MKRPIATGTRVTDRSAAAAMASVLVQASGSNSRPSWASRAKTGTKDTVMMSRLKKRAGPTSFADAVTTSHRSRVVRTFVCSASSSPPPGRATPSAWALAFFSSMACSRCLCMFSTMTIAASIMAPMAIAIPPRLMMSAPMPSPRMAMKAMRMPRGRVTRATRALRTCQRKRTVTSPTISDSSRSFVRRVSMARWIRSERSYTGRTTSPPGMPGASSASRSFTRSMVASAFSPKRMTTIPPTASPRPFRSATPRRTSGASRTSATSATRMGMPWPVEATTTSSMSPVPSR